MLAVMAVGLLGLSWPVHLNMLRPHKAEPPAKVQRFQAQRVITRLYELKGWQIAIRKDGFTGKITCRLHAFQTLSQGRITYEQKTLGFELGEHVDTLNAWYSIDGQAPQRWQTLYPQLTAQRVPLEGGSLENPTGGVVLIPVDLLRGAAVVTIRADEKSAPRDFKLKGFDQALAAAQYNGCASDESFERDSW